MRLVKRVLDTVFKDIDQAGLERMAERRRNRFERPNAHDTRVHLGPNR